jgi:hypothetical protein
MGNAMTHPITLSAVQAETLQDLRETLRRGAEECDELRLTPGCCELYYKSLAQALTILSQAEQASDNGPELRPGYDVSIEGDLTKSGEAKMDAWKAAHAERPSDQGEGDKHATFLREQFRRYLPEWEYHGSQIALLQVIWDYLLATREPSPSAEPAERTEPVAVMLEASKQDFSAPELEKNFLHHSAANYWHDKYQEAKDEIAERDEALRKSNQELIRLNLALVKAEAAERAMREALEQIVEIEQSHCYSVNSEASPYYTAQSDLRSCGDIARSMLVARAALAAEPDKPV